MKIAKAEFCSQFDPTLGHKLWGSSEHVHYQKNQALCWQYGLYAGTVKLLVSAKKLVMWEVEEEKKPCIATYDRNFDFTERHINLTWK